MPPARTLRLGPEFLGLAIVMLVVGCAAPRASAAPATTGPPAVPDGWQLVASDSGDVRLALPPDIPVMFTEVGIMAWLPVVDGALQLEVHARVQRRSRSRAAGKTSARGWNDPNGYLALVIRVTSPSPQRP